MGPGSGRGNWGSRVREGDQGVQGQRGGPGVQGQGGEPVGPGSGTGTHSPAHLGLGQNEDQTLLLGGISTLKIF